jgi:methyl-accepting chemotaxis protein
LKRADSDYSRKYKWRKYMNKLSIQWKISIALFALVLCVFSNFIGIQLWISGSKAYGTVINLAGRQRMLTQKMTKEAMFIVNGFDAKNDVGKTKQLFEHTLNGLIDGDEELGLPPAKNKEIKAQLQKVKGLWSNFKNKIDETVSGQGGNKDMLYTSSLEILKEMNRGVKMMEEDSSKAIGRLRTGALITFLISLLVAATAFYFVRRNIISQLHATVDVAERLKDGDLTVEIDVLSGDETGELQSAMKGMVESLKKMVGQIMGHSHTMASNSEEVSVTTAQITTGIDDQSQQIEQAVSATTEVSQTIMDVAKNATDASDSARESVEIANDGKSVVEQTVSSMMKIAANVETSSKKIGELGESSKKIGDIIDVINDIASQTNLLALNAAIEAARAGEQGRGFAVVADEVRKLAEKTSQATEEIIGMINKIQQDTNVSVQSMDKNKTEAEEGVKLAGQAKESLDKIVAASEQCLDMVQSIAASTEEQSAAIEQVSSGMENVAGVFGSSREGVSQINMATNELARISSELMQLVSWFKMDARSASHKSSGNAVNTGQGHSAHGF